MHRRPPGRTPLRQWGSLRLIGYRTRCGFVREAWPDHLTRWYDYAAMRTTLNIDDVLVAARAPAVQNGSSLGRALSELARRGFEDPAMFRVPADAQHFTSDDVYQSLSKWP